MLIGRPSTPAGPIDIGFIFCSGYCGEKRYTMESFKVIQQIFNYPIHFHKLIFRAGNGRRVQARRIGLHLYFRRVYESGYNICSKIVGRAKSNRLSMLCDDNMLAVIQLGKSHNLSIHFIRPDERIDGDVTTQMLDRYSVFHKGMPPNLTYWVIV